MAHSDLDANMKISHLCVLTGCFISLGAFAGETLPAVDGTYRVRGECYERTEDGEYKPCVAWNQLILKPGSVAGSYAYTLDTNTFATTQGGCGLEGVVSMQKQTDGLFLVAVGEGADICPIRFKVDKKTLTLDMPEAQADAPACRSACGSNASLYTDPFPRASRRK